MTYGVHKNKTYEGDIGVSVRVWNMGWVCKRGKVGRNSYSYTYMGMHIHTYIHVYMNILYKILCVCMYTSRDVSSDV